MTSTPYQVGQIVSDFTMEAFDPKTQGFAQFSLEKARKDGKWTVLVFYPADFTFVCATEFQALAELHPEFEKLGAEVVSVSCDTKFVHLAWHREEKELQNVKFLMGADPTAQMAEMFGIYLQDSGVPLRGTYIIGPDGKLMNAEVNFLNLGRNMNELLRKVKANLYLSKHGAEACPAHWKDQGDATLKPGPALVGRVHQSLHK